MASRLELHEELCDILGSRNVYYQPPESLKLKYPCIVYSKPNSYSAYANNKINYFKYDVYDITLIYKDSENALPDKILEHFDYIRLNRHYTADNLYHDAFNLFY